MLMLYNIHVYNIMIQRKKTTSGWPEDWNMNGLTILEVKNARILIWISIVMALNLIKNGTELNINILSRQRMNS